MACASLLVVLCCPSSQQSRCMALCLQGRCSAGFVCCCALGSVCTRFFVVWKLHVQSFACKPLPSLGSGQPNCFAEVERERSRERERGREREGEANKHMHTQTPTVPLRCCFVFFFVCVCFFGPCMSFHFPRCAARCRCTDAGILCQTGEQHRSGRWCRAQVQVRVPGHSDAARGCVLVVSDWLL